MKLQQEIQQAVNILRNGGLVALPTETVYGLAGDAGNPESVNKIYTAKGRPASHPLIVHIGDPDLLPNWAVDIPEQAYQLALAFWPGPLTMVLKKHPQVSEGITAGQQTIAVRIPRHPTALAVLKAFGGGLVAPSANRFTRISPTTARAVQQELGDKVDMILDGGPCDVGLESTIVDLTSETLRILRPGMISAQAISEVLGQQVQVARQDYPDEVRTPGMHHLHYAPETSAQLISLANLPNQVANSQRVIVLALTVIEDEKLTLASNITIKQMPTCPDDYARIIYQTLRDCDQAGVEKILLEEVPADKKWDAVRDRLIKACGITPEGK